jgi:hypothetical protein
MKLHNMRVCAQGRTCFGARLCSARLPLAVLAFATRVVSSLPISLCALLGAGNVTAAPPPAGLGLKATNNQPEPGCDTFGPFGVSKRPVQTPICSEVTLLYSLLLIWGASDSVCNAFPPHQLSKKNINSRKYKLAMPTIADFAHTYKPTTHSNMRDSHYKCLHVSTAHLKSHAVVWTANVRRPLFCHVRLWPQKSKKDDACIPILFGMVSSPSP